MGQDRLTLLDIAREKDPNGSPAMVLEVLNETNPMLQDAPAYPANAPMAQRNTLRSSLPTVAFGKINQGVTRSKGTSRQVQDTIGMIVGLSEADAKLLPIEGSANFEAARWNQDAGFLEAMSELAADTLVYGDESTDETEFTGLAARMPSLASALTGSQVVSYGSDEETDIQSIYIVDWGERACHLIYPPNSTAGIVTDNLGKQRVTDADGNPFTAFVTEYTWMLGLTCKDPRHMARLCNIDLSDAAADTSFTLGLKLIDVLAAMPDPGGNQRVLYCTNAMLAAFMKQLINNQAMGHLSIREYQGRPTPHFWDFPIRRCDAVASDETVLT